MKGRLSVRVCSSGRRKPDGGFCLISGTMLLAAWWAYRRAIIRLYDLRVWFACFELMARRCVRQKGDYARFSGEELHALVGGAGGEHVHRAICRLEVAGLLSWSKSKIEIPESAEGLSWADSPGFGWMLASVANHRRKVPVPRRTVRFLAGGARRAVIATALGHLLRCLYYRGGLCLPEGRCKSSWIAEVFEVGIRNVKAARTHLASIGWLVTSVAPQRSLNRWGAVVELNLSWSRDWPAARTDSTPPPALSPTESAPPYKNEKLSSRSGNQKPAERGPFGVSAGKGRVASPTLTQVVLEDLHDVERLEMLRSQAVDAGFVTSSECDRLRFFGAAEHALVIGTRNPCGLFAAMVHRGLWAFITQDDENEARRKVKVLDERPASGKLSRSAQTGERVPEEAGVVQREASGPAAREEQERIRRLVRESLESVASVGEWKPDMLRVPDCLGTHPAESVTSRPFAAG